jgi:hypothetical protein
MNLTGAGTVISLSPASVNFGNQPVNTKSQGQTITLTNLGAASVTINSIAITGADAGDFAKSQTCGSSIAAGASCTIETTFHPTVKGARTATLVVNDNGGGFQQTVSLSGTGT